MAEQMATDIVNKSCATSFEMLLLRVTLNCHTEILIEIMTEQQESSAHRISLSSRRSVVITKHCATLECVFIYRLWTYDGLYDGYRHMIKARCRYTVDVNLRLAHSFDVLINAKTK